MARINVGGHDVRPPGIRFKVVGGARSSTLMVGLRSRIRRSKVEHDCIVIVGYRTEYAPAIHENMTMKLFGQPRKPPRKGTFWGPQGRSKFLEAPSRSLRDVFRAIIIQGLMAGETLKRVLWRVGKYLQVESQKRVPVETKELRDSAFTRYD